MFGESEDENNEDFPVARSPGGGGGKSRVPVSCPDMNQRDAESDAEDFTVRYPNEV